MPVTTEDGGRTNMYATEPQMYIDPKIEDLQLNESYETHNTKAERPNSRLAMLGVIAAIGD